MKKYEKKDKHWNFPESGGAYIAHWFVAVRWVPKKIASNIGNFEAAKRFFAHILP